MLFHWNGSQTHIFQLRAVHLAATSIPHKTAAFKPFVLIFPQNDKTEPVSDAQNVIFLNQENDGRKEGSSLLSASWHQPRESFTSCPQPMLVQCNQSQMSFYSSPQIVAVLLLSDIPVQQKNDPPPQSSAGKSREPESKGLGGSILMLTIINAFCLRQVKRWDIKTCRSNPRGQAWVCRML